MAAAASTISGGRVVATTFTIPSGASIACGDDAVAASFDVTDEAALLLLMPFGGPPSESPIAIAALPSAVQSSVVVAGCRSGDRRSLWAGPWSIVLIGAESATLHLDGLSGSASLVASEIPSAVVERLESRIEVGVTTSSVGAEHPVGAGGAVIELAWFPQTLAAESLRACAVADPPARDGRYAYDATVYGPTCGTTAASTTTGASAALDTMSYVGLGAFGIEPREYGLGVFSATLGAARDAAALAVWLPDGVPGSGAPVISFSGSTPGS